MEISALIKSLEGHPDDYRLMVLIPGGQGLKPILWLTLSSRGVWLDTRGPQKTPMTLGKLREHGKAWSPHQALLIHQQDPAQIPKSFKVVGFEHIDQSIVLLVEG